MLPLQSKSPELNAVKLMFLLLFRGGGAKTHPEIQNVVIYLQVISLSTVTVMRGRRRVAACENSVAHSFQEHQLGLPADEKLSKSASTLFRRFVMNSGSGASFWLSETTSPSAFWAIW